MMLGILLALAFSFSVALIVWLAVLIRRLERRQNQMITKMGWRITDI